MRRAALALFAVAALSAGCAGPANTDHRQFHVTWTARNAKDKTLFTSVTSSPVEVGGPELRFKTGAGSPMENRPVFKEFVAKIRPMPGQATVELQTRASVRETYRTKKGKLKVSGRFIGALLPIRQGETLLVNGPADPIDLQVRLMP